MYILQGIPPRNTQSPSNVEIWVFRRAHLCSWTSTNRSQRPATAALRIVLRIIILKTSISSFRWSYYGLRSSSQIQRNPTKVNLTEAGVGFVRSSSRIQTNPSKVDMTSNRVQLDIGHNAPPPSLITSQKPITNQSETRIK